MPISAIKNYFVYRGLQKTMEPKMIRQNLMGMGVVPKPKKTVRKIAVMEKAQRSGYFCMLRAIAAKVGPIKKVFLPDYPDLLGNSSNIKPIDFTVYDVDKVCDELFDDRTRFLHLATIRTFGNNSNGDPKAAGRSTFPGIGITLAL